MSKKAKKQNIDIGISDLTDKAVANMLESLTAKRLHELARLNGTPIRKYKYETAEALARAINAPGRGCNFLVKIQYV